MIVAYEFVHVSTMLFCVDVLITQYFYKTVRLQKLRTVFRQIL